MPGIHFISHCGMSEVSSVGSAASRINLVVYSLYCST